MKKEETKKIKVAFPHMGTICVAWEMALKSYLGTEDEAVCRSVAEKAMIIGYTRMLRRSIRRPNEADSPAKIARCKEMLAYLLDKVDTLVFSWCAENSLDINQ